MELIDRYLAAIAKQSPPAERIRIVKLVRSEIMAAMAADETDGSEAEKVEHVLLVLGPPSRVVNRYLKVPHYIIGPAVYDAYWRVLTIVLWVVVGSMTLATGLDLVVNGSALNWPTIGFQYLTGVLSALAQAFFWITLVFVLFERRGITIDFTDDWHPNELPVVSKLGGEIPRSEPLAGLFITSIFFVICYFMPEVIGIYYQSADGWHILPIFDLEGLQRFLPLFLIIFASSSGREIAKLMSGQWNYPVLAVTIIGNLLVIGTLIVLLWQPTIWNPQFIREFITIFGVDRPLVQDWEVLRRTGIFILIGIGVLDSVVSSIRVWKLHRTATFLGE